MTAGGFNKAGWTWTAKGWKRIPKLHAKVKKVALATKRRPRKLHVMHPAAKRPKAPAPEASNLSVEQGRAVSAPTLAPDPEKLATRPIRQAWSGKYDALTTPPREES